MPPVREQERIVAEVERRFSVVDKIEIALKADLTRAERLRQAILKRAFEGGLVPQDPNDEPANVLLERIRAERASREAEAQPKKSARKKKAKAADESATLFSSTRSNI
jgi:type I restriction enzyme S subunit